MGNEQKIIFLQDIDWNWHEFKYEGVLIESLKNEIEKGKYVLGNDATIGDRATIGERCDNRGPCDNRGRSNFITWILFKRNKTYGYLCWPK